MAYVRPVQYRRPKAPSYNKGVLVIHSDDGYSGDYTHWLALCKKKTAEYSQWVNDGTAVMCPAVNTATIGTAGMMTVNNLLEMLDSRCEILSHGRHHVGIGAYPLILPANAGATRLDVKAAAQINVGVYQYKIVEGATEEVMQIAQTSGNSSADGYVITATPIVNSYTTAAKIILTDESAHVLLQGCIDDLRAWGIDCKHHVYTYHGGGDHFPTPKAQEWVSKYFISGRGSAIPAVPNYPNTINKAKLSSVLNVEQTNAEVDALLNETSTNDCILIYYGHGEKDANLAQLEYLIDGALSRGIRIKTMTGALKYFGVM